MRRVLVVVPQHSTRLHHIYEDWGGLHLSKFWGWLGSQSTFQTILFFILRQISMLSIRGILALPVWKKSKGRFILNFRSTKKLKIFFHNLD